MTNNQNIILTLELAYNQKIIVFSDDNRKSISGYSYETVIFHKNNQLYPLSAEFPLHLFLATLQKLLQKSLSYNLKLHDSITHDIGYLWNQWLNDDNEHLIYTTNRHNDTHWVGLQYELSSHEYVSWIYNDQKNNIVFEITPAYPLGCIDLDDVKEVQQYQNWIKAYKPTFKAIILQETAIQWIDEIQQILNVIDKNTQK